MATPFCSSEQVDTQCARGDEACDGGVDPGVLVGTGSCEGEGEEHVVGEAVFSHGVLRVRWGSVWASGGG